MGSSVKSSEVPEIPKNSRSLDLQSLYAEKAEGSGLKRKKQSSETEEFVLGQSRKKKRSRKEVPISSFESVNKNSKKRINAEDGLGLDQCVLEGKDLVKKISDQVNGVGNLSHFGANDVPIPKRPRCFTRRKKSQSNHLFMQARNSEKVSSDVQSVKLTNHFVTPSLSVEDKPKKVSESLKENSSSKTNLTQSSKGKDSTTHNYKDIVPKIVRRNHKKRLESKPHENTGVDKAKSSFNKVVKPCVELHEEEDDDDNLEENAARMLSSRFDPSCTGFSGNETALDSQPVNGLSFGSSIHGDFASLQSNHSADLENNFVDSEGRVLRPRRKFKKNRLTRKRRHYYEILSKNVDAYWVVNRNIKVFWPLDQSWYFGLITNFDPERNMHHVKYDDREEEWISLQNERFKLLLLPNEAPHKPDSEKLRAATGYVSKEKGGAEVEDDDDLSSYLESEPLILWLVRSTRRVKSSPAMKRRKLHSQSKNIMTAMLSEDSVTTVSDYMVDDTFRTDASNVSNDPIAHEADDNEASETQSSKEKMVRYLYSRKRFRQRSQGLGSASDNSKCRSIVVYDPNFYSIGRFVLLKEHDESHQCFGLDDLCPGFVLWSGENLGLLKLTASPSNLRQVALALALRIPLQSTSNAFRAENLWMCHTLMLLQDCMLMVMWPNVQLEMLFVDNVVGLRFFLFEGCLMQAVAFVCLVLIAFHQPDEKGEPLDPQIPVTSIRFEISGFPSFRRRFIFVLYNFVEVKSSKWLCLDNKFKKCCTVTKRLSLSECTYDNIKFLQSRSSIPLYPSVCRDPVSLEGSRKKSRQGIMHKRITKESAYINMGLSSSSFSEKPKRVPQFLLPFAAAPTFFMSLHLKLLLAKNVASISFCNPLLLLEGPENDCKPVANDISPIEDISDHITHDNVMDCSLSRTADLSGLLSSTESEVDVDVISRSNEGDLATTSQNCLDSTFNVVGTSVGLEDSASGANNDSNDLCATSSWPPIEGGHSSQDKCDTEFLTRLNGMKVQIPTSNETKIQASDGKMQVTQQSPCDSVWSVNDCAIGSPNPTAPRSMWHRNRTNSGSLSFGSRMKMWPDGRVELSHSGLVNGSRKPRSQVSYLLPFGNYDFNSKPRSHHRKGHPYKRMRIDSEKMVPNGSGIPQKRREVMSCDANVLITAGDRGWRECGANVVLESVDHNEWRLLVKVSGVTKYFYKAYQFLQPGTTNRFTHVMMWKGGKDWTLEFPDRTQWALFKEMHEECYNRNLRAVSIKTIPIPGVRLIEEIDDNGIEVPFVRSSPKYLLQVETDVDMALNPSRILYDMDSDDELWISRRSVSADSSVSCLMEISDEMFERTMDMLEKVAYAQQREDFILNEIEELMVVGLPIDLIKEIYDYWKQKRRTKWMPLIRQLQPPLWERYQQQLKEWELTVNKVHHFPNGCKEKALLLEKPQMFAFCLRPRGLEVPNKGSKQRSHRKVSAGGHSCSFSRDSDGHHSFGRRSNGFVYGDERYTTGSNHDYASSWQPSTRVISPRDALSSGYQSMSSDGSERSQRRKLNRSKSRKLGTITSHNDSQTMATSYNHNLVSKRNGVVTRYNTALPEWPSQNQYQREGFQKHRVERLGGPDLDEFRLRDASSAAQHASNMAKLKREKAQRLFYRADVAIHKAMVALMTAEAIKASSEDSTEDG